MPSIPGAGPVDHAYAGPRREWPTTTSLFPDVASVSNAEAALRRDWDDALGYYYLLELTVPAAGEVKVALRTLASPKAPLTTTEAEMAAFQREFRQRPSQFPRDPAAFRLWQASHRAKLAAWLMGGGLPPRVPLEARVIETQDFADFSLRRVEYRSQKDRTNVLLISLPKGVKRAPLLLGLHGHENAWGQAAASAYRMGEADDFCA